MAKEFVETTLLDGFADGPHITVEQVGSANQGLYGPSDYVMDAGRNAEAQILTNNSIRIFDAVFVIQGRRDVIAANDYEDINIDNGAQGMNRNDIIVRRYTKDESSEIERTEYAVIKGTPTPSVATDPDVTVGNIRNGDTLHEMKLYRVKLEGLNIVAIEPLFQVLMNMNKINKYLSDTSDKLKADYIVENYVSGDNSAMYRKWNSGLLEVWLASVTVVPVNIAWGNVFRSDSQVGKNYPEKAKFIAPPIVTMTVKTDLSDVAWITPKDSESKTRLPNYYLVRGTRMDATAKYFINAYAVGRWK